jgi:hypothetical protein
MHVCARKILVSVPTVVSLSLSPEIRVIVGLFLNVSDLQLHISRDLFLCMSVYVCDVCINTYV